MNVYVLQMSSGEHLGLSRVLVDERRGELLRQWRQYRGELERARVPSKLETVGPFDIEIQGENGATVTVHVRPIWWDGPTSLAGTAQPWRFETRRSASGWRVWEADLPAWCGVHVRANACR